MKKLVLMMVCVMFLASVSFARMGTESGGKTEPVHRGMHKDMIEELNLSEEQVEALHQKRTENLKKQIEIKNNIKLAMIDLQEELRKKDLDRKKIDKIVDKIGALKKEMFVNRVNAVIGFREILTEEQLEKARALAILKIKGEGMRMKPKEGKKYPRGK